MPSKPAATQRSMPSVPCAWALARSPRRWASGVIASSSAGPNGAARGVGAAGAAAGGHHLDEVGARGHSRDGKQGTLQIVFGLLCTAQGCPVAVEVFAGSTSDPKTVAAQVDKIRHRFGLGRVVLVGDRGMLTGARIREHLQGLDGLRWITTLRAPTIRKLIAAGRVTP